MTEMTSSLLLLRTWSGMFVRSIMSFVPPSVSEDAQRGPHGRMKETDLRRGRLVGLDGIL